MHVTRSQKLGSILATLVAACSTGDSPPPDEPAAVVEIIARGLTFEAPSAISSGWTTFRLKNESGMIHFALLQRVPEGIGIEEQQRQVAPVFQAGFDLLIAGEADAAFAKFGELPDWFGDIVFLGGPGFTSPGLSSEATMYLEPGTYLLECYVKTGGTFHSYNPDPDAYGMVHELRVTNQISETVEPVPTLQITLSSDRGIGVQGDPVAGQHTVAVRFEDQVAHDNFVGHDVHLVRLSDDTAFDELVAWMDWTGPTGLETPAPAVFVGGLNELPAGATGYFTVVLEPGRYAWISEVPGAEAKGMFQPFTVAGDD